jgi:hypothetical protein
MGDFLVVFVFKNNASGPASSIFFKASDGKWDCPSGAKLRGLAHEKSSFRVAGFGLSALCDFNRSGVYRINLVHPCWNVAGR